MKKIQSFLLLSFIVLLPFFSTAQYSNPSPQKIPLKDRLQIGGYFGLTFGTITNIEIAPNVGYMVSPKFTAGLGIRYSYYNDNYYHYTSNSYGGTIFGRYIVFQGLFLEGDFEANNFDVAKFNDPLNPSVYTIERAWVPSLLLGGGYVEQFSGGRSAFFLSVLYDVLQDQYSPYYRIPVIRVGVGIGI